MKHVPTFEPSTKRQSLTIHIVGFTLIFAGVGILLAGVVEAIDGGPDVLELLLCGAAASVIGWFSWNNTDVPHRMQTTDVFTAVSLSWIVLSFAAAIPYMVTGTLTSFDDALFEAVSGLTTTGATVLPKISDASQGLLFWRATTQWLGGMGVIVLVVAILPTFGSGGMDLLEAESPGPTGERLTPRVRNTARRLWGVYIGFTIVLAVAYNLAGMSLYDSVSHSFTTVSTGGFSPHDASLAHFDSSTIEWIAIFAMFLAGTSFTLLYRVLKGKVGSLFYSGEFRLYLALIAASTAVVYFTAGETVSGFEGLRDAAFAVTSIVSTTGYGTEDFGQWAQSSQAIILMLMPLGAMAGSTAGGVKIVRILAVTSFARREVMRQIHPGLVRPTRIGRSSLDDHVTNRVVGFLILILGFFGLGAMYTAVAGADIVTALSASATAIGNVGPGLGDISPASNFLAVPRTARWVAMVLMLLGRLEIYPILLAAAAVPLHFRRRGRRDKAPTVIGRR